MFTLHTAATPHGDKNALCAPSMVVLGIEQPPSRIDFERGVEEALKRVEMGGSLPGNATLNGNPS